MRAFFVRGQRLLPLVLAGLGLAVLWWGWHNWRPLPAWSNEELALLGSLSLTNLAPLPPAPGNAVADNPKAASLGERLFRDTRLSGNGEISCASCHQPERRFTDGLPQGQALATVQRNTPSLVGVAWSPWLYWDGRKDSLWSQALAPLEAAAEHGSNRMRLARLLTTAPEYRSTYVELFGEPPDFSDKSRFPDDAGPVPHTAWHTAWQHMAQPDRYMVSLVFANLGKLIAAWERQLVPEPTRLDHYIDQLQQPDGDAAALLDRDERAGLRLFIGEARCLECHNGPLLTNNEFHNTGLLPWSDTLPDQGRGAAIDSVLADPFNCLGAFSDAQPEQCQELVHIRRGPELTGAFRTPSLRNLAGTAPYMHRGQMQTLGEIVEHYNRAPLAVIGHSEATALNLGATERRQLERFLRVLME